MKRLFTSLLGLVLAAPACEPPETIDWEKVQIDEIRECVAFPTATALSWFQGAELEHTGTFLYLGHVRHLSEELLGLLELGLLVRDTMLLTMEATIVREVVHSTTGARFESFTQCPGTGDGDEASAGDIRFVTEILDVSQLQPGSVTGHALVEFRGCRTATGTLEGTAAIYADDAVIAVQPDIAFEVPDVGTLVVDAPFVASPEHLQICTDIPRDGTLGLEFDRTTGALLMRGKGAAITCSPATSDPDAWDCEWSGDGEQPH